MRLPRPSMWYAAPDYLRLTTKGGNDGDEAKAVYRKGAYAVVAAAEGGAVDFERWAWNGYYGERFAAVAYGAGAQGAILQVSGWQAADDLLLGMPYDNVARVDAQITCWYEEDTPQIARLVADMSKGYRSFANGNRWKVRYIDGGGDGDTTYIGSRSSDSFIRCYDKWRESGRDDDYRHAWRFEVEFKGEEANNVWTEKGATAQGPDVWAGIVLSRLRAKGVILPGLGDLARLAPRPIKREASSVEKRLAWLRNQVAPAIDKLQAQGVSLEHIREALGLS